MPTSELVERLKFRDGVAATQAEPYEPYVVKGVGPATILVVKD
ncbi:MAG: BC1881 family protein [Oscillospiraceae bacterium]|nr:BC1881 family protein [Oscillospiraceae bacterium]